jgi:hypothetical protein
VIGWEVQSQSQSVSLFLDSSLVIEGRKGVSGGAEVQSQSQSVTLCLDSSLWIEGRKGVIG